MRAMVNSGSRQTRANKSYIVNVMTGEAVGDRPFPQAVFEKERCREPCDSPLFIGAAACECQDHGRMAGE
jgi:hypothetical protein